MRGRNGGNADNKAGLPKAAIKATKEVVRAMTEMADLIEYNTMRYAIGSRPKAGIPQLSQPMFEGSAQNEVMN